MSATFDFETRFSDAQDVSVEHHEVGGEALPGLTGLGLLV